MSVIGIDVDGVLAEFNSAYVRLVVEESKTDRPFGFKRDGQDVYVPFSNAIQTVPELFPHIWSYPEDVGYTDAQVRHVWRRIGKSTSFWSSLAPYPTAKDDISTLNRLRDDGHDVYFVTSRPGVAAKRQTEDWLDIVMGMKMPTVILSSDKATAISFLKLDAYLDDRLLNVNDCMRMVRERRLMTRVYLQDRPWNRYATMSLDPETVPPLSEWDTWVDPAAIRVGSVSEMIAKEGL